MKRILSFGLVLLLIPVLFLVSACGGGSTTANTTPTIDARAGFTAATVAKGAPFKLVFLTQPGNAKAFEPFGVQPVVGILDSDGNIVSTANLAVSVGLTPETAGSSPMSGVLQVVSVNGKATFTNVNIQGGGKGFILVARSSGLQNAFSEPFNVEE
ncbi:MAG TPA: hypothetical protein VLH15_11245 [Dehalococcoidales bacterium]|nr:hypothetical protein [Dehalococcoidales bacterium]